MVKKIDRREFFQSSAFLGVTVLGTGALSGVDKIYYRKPLSKSTPDIAVAHGKDAFKNTIKAVESIGGIEKFVKSGDKVVILPNPQGRIPSTSTNPEVVRAVVRMCKEAGAREVICTGKHPIKAWQRNGHKKAVESEGGKIFPLSYPTRTNRKFNRDQYVKIKVPNGKRIRIIEVDRNVIENDVFITIPICKQHIGCNFTGTMKNFMGINLENTYFHAHDWEHLDNCIVDLNLNLKFTFAVVDGMSILLSNGPFGPGKTTDPLQVIAGTDRVAIDTYCATKLVGLELEKVPTIIRAHKEGLGEIDLNKVNIIHIEV
ncbi:hypothetical protein DRQ09_09080 [candidate division KSB1 bacterium]|nr:MAG: hypothetical protein DRQ09_09080 [candidate division KSB1 bacterium]